jgi:thiol-disulfide isomerase/thioredoxin
VIAAAAFAIVFNLDQTLQTHLGSYTSALQRHTENSGYATRHLGSLRGGKSTLKAKPAANAPGALPDYGSAPNFEGIADWLNTPGDRPLTIAGLRGKVVLVDFWTYSCINCLRTLPQLRAWYATYRKDGFQIVGVHTPEFAFEHVLSNVTSATRRLHVSWPVALDNNDVTWTLYANQYWPADYLVDRRGQVRAIHFGEGGYDQTEHEIRTLLGVSGPTTHVESAEPSELTTPETYVGPQRLDSSRYVGSKLTFGRQATYTPAANLPQNAISFAGRWTLSGQTATAGRDAQLLLHFNAKDVYVVLAGHGQVHASLAGRRLSPLPVDGDRLYTVLSSPRTLDGLLRLKLTPGLRAYSFTFG